MKPAASFVVVLLLLDACAGSRGVFVVRSIRVEVVDLDTHQRSVLEETLGVLEGMEAKPPGISNAEYVRDTSFVRTFGIGFSGTELATWWSQRIERVSLGSAWTVAVYGGDRDLVVRPDFFSLPLVERLAVLIHEARHADGDGFKHVDCPPGFGLSSKPACDASPVGAYAHQAAFLYELYARDLIDGKAARRGWLSARQRILR